MRVLLVEEKGGHSLETKSFLGKASILVEQVSGGEEALEMLRLYEHDLILIGPALSDMTGTEALRKLREAQLRTPALLLMAPQNAQEKLHAFALGADDVLVAPFDPAELLARIQAIIRRSKGHSQSTLKIGPLSLCLVSQTVTVSGASISLTGKEYAILELLALRKGSVLTKQIFLDHLYGGLDEPEMKIIDVFVCNLRKKLARAGAANLIETVWGRGYALREHGAMKPHGQAAGFAAVYQQAVA